MEPTAIMSGRHPYTYAADFIRQSSEALISRSDASQIRQEIAKAIGMDDRELACRLSEAFQAGQLEAKAKLAVERLAAQLTG